MKLAKDDVIAALRLRYDHHSAQMVFDSARTRAGLAEQPTYDTAEVTRFRAALATVGDRLTAVEQRLDALGGGPGAPEPVPTPLSPEPPPPAPPPAPMAETAPAPTRGSKRKPSNDAAAIVETTIALAGVDAPDGDQILICGGLPELGEWDPDRACAMTREGDRWIARLELATGREIACKFLRRGKDGAVIWEDGENRTLAPAPRIDLTWRSAPSS
jgi:hypothetical protein